VELPEPETLVCFREGLPIDERLTRIDEELFPAPQPTSLSQLRERLRSEVFRYFPADRTALDAEWGKPEQIQGRVVQTVSFASFEGIRVRARLSLPQNTEGKLPALIVVDDRKGIPVWGNEQPLERNRWGNRAVLIVETLDRGSRALEQNLRSFADNDALHHMRRLAMVIGTTLESMQVYEVLRAIELLRSLPQIDSDRISITGRYQDGINGLYAALLDGKGMRVILGSPPASHREGPHYLRVLRYTDIPQTLAAMAENVSVYGEVPAGVAGKARRCASLAACLD
jgi:hypothetical protein